jgi:cytochrome c oxidase assembly protein subunit 15
LLKLRNFILFFWFYNLIVIVWGAWVRISKSGDGCGESWPLCKGEVIPTSRELATWVEFSHRLSTGLYLLIVTLIVILVFRFAKRSAFGESKKQNNDSASKKITEKSKVDFDDRSFDKANAKSFKTTDRPSDGNQAKYSLAKKMALAVLGFTIAEALIGAGLVVFGLVAENATVARAYAMAFHQVTSLLLTAAIVLLFEGLKGNVVFQFPKKAGIFALGFFLLIAVTGAVAALSGTLFPSESLLDGFIKDFSSDSHILVRLRVAHPIVASLAGAGIFLWMGYRLVAGRLSGSQVKRTREFLGVLGVAIIFGFSTLFMLSPDWMKMVHLALAHILFSAFVRSFTVIDGEKID